MSPEKTISPINNLKGIIDASIKRESPKREINFMRIEDVQNQNSPSKGGNKIESVSLQSFNAMFEKLSPRTESKVS